MPRAVAFRPASLGGGYRSTACIRWTRLPQYLRTTTTPPVTQLIGPNDLDSNPVESSYSRGWLCFACRILACTAHISPISPPVRPFPSGNSETKAVLPQLIGPKDLDSNPVDSSYVRSWLCFARLAPGVYSPHLPRYHLRFAPLRRPTL
jgi:hypothetical protein